MANFYVLVCCERKTDGEMDRMVEGIFVRETLAVKAIPYVVPSYRNTRTARLPPICFMVQECNLNEIMVFDEEYEGLMDVAEMAYTGDSSIKPINYYDIQGNPISMSSAFHDDRQTINDQLDGYGQF